MKLLVVLCLAFAAAQALDIDRLRHVHPSMPVNPRHTWQEWQDIMAAQELVPEIVPYPGFEKQPEESGKTVVPMNPDWRVIGGTIASQGQIPWQAALTLDGSGFCGGSLISSIWILTAAHCTYRVSTVQIVLGASNIQQSQSGTVTQVSRNIIVHSSYSSSSLNNDISVIRLTSSVPSTTYIRPIRLPRSSQASNTFQGASVIVSGFGRTSGTSGISPYLRYASLTVISNTNCAAYFGSSITSSKICTTGANGKSPCNGDSGGPLFLQESDGQSTQVGLVSFGSNGCLASYPAAFTRITSYLSWISANTGITIQP